MPARRLLCTALVVGSLAVTTATAGELVPLRGRWSGITVAADVSGFPIVAVVASGEGRGTHLGRFAMVSPHLNNVFTFEVEGDQIFTGANGDTLTSHFRGQFTPNADGSLSSVIPCVITGGTGRFAGATGSYDFDITAVPLADGSGFASTATIDGWISTVGSGK